MSLNLDVNLGHTPAMYPTGDVDLSARKLVPNVFPTVHDLPYRLAIIGEAPGADEELHGQPFIGASGQLLTQLLTNANILRSACLITNICQVRPPGNDIKYFEWDSPEIQSGLRQLDKDLKAFQPNCLLLLGNTALRAAKGPDHSISDERGFIFRCAYPGSPLDGYKCVPTYHPASILRQYENKPLAQLDIKKARQEAQSPDLVLPLRNIEHSLPAGELVHRLDNWPAGLECSMDIEGVLGGWTCIGLSDHPLHAFVIHWISYTPEEHIQILCALSRLCWRRDVPKCLQNSLYDNFVMCFGYKILIRNVRNDTMLKGWSKYCELPKGLDTQASIYTRQPSWKHLIAYSKKEREKRRKAGVDEYQEKVNKWIACGIDCSVTLEISNVQSTILDGRPREHYEFNVSLLEPLLYMQLRGICYDKEKATARLAETNLKIAEKQLVLNTQTGRVLNINSPKQLCQYLYNEKGFDPIYKKEHGRNTDRLTTDVEALLTLHKKYADPAVATILELRRLDSTRETLEITTDPDGRVRCGYNIVGTDTGRLTCYRSPTGSGANLQTITEDLRDLYTADPGNDFCQCDLEGADGWTIAVRCKLLGDPTMFDDYKAGIKPAKVIVLMYETLQQALELHKPKKAFEIEAIKQKILEGFIKMDREKLAELCSRVGKDGWLYFGCKRVQHATNYGVGERTGSAQILKDSYKKVKDKPPIHLPPSEFKLLQSLYIDGRYKGAKLWQRWVENELVSKTTLSAASGQLRRFFGRIKTGQRTDLETLKAALSHEPQANTTYATNLAMSRLWNDRGNKIGGVHTHENGNEIITCDGEHHFVSREIPSVLTRLVPGALVIEPLHQVHDALCTQWPTELRTWARPKMRSFFDNTLTIDHFDFIIPFDGRFGRSWGELTEKL